MTDLPVASRQAVVALVERCPDKVLRDLGVGLRTFPGARARAVQTIIETEQAARAVRARVFGALEPMFRPRPDGVAAPSFPPALGRAIWQGLRVRQPRLVDQAVPSCQVPEPPVAVLDQLCASAASLLRDEAERLWPSDPDLALDVAVYFDLAPLARRALPKLPAWTGLISEAEAVELRLLMRDVAEVAPDGAPRVLEILFANIAHAPLILRVISHTSGAASDEGFLAGSELSDFGERLFQGVEARTDRFCAYDPRIHDAKAAQAAADDVAKVSELLDELGLSLDLSPEGPWGKRAQGLRTRISKHMNDALGACEKAVDQALPLERVQTTGRMTRAQPRLDAPIDGPVMDKARSLMALFGAVRLTAGAFGCGSRRAAVAEALSRRLGTYGDEAMEEINAGSPDDLAHAMDLVRVAADFLAAAGDDATAKALRRRVAAADAAGASQHAA